MTPTTLFEDAQVAELYAKHRSASDHDFIDQVARDLDPSAGSLLDIGAGVGAPADALRARGFDVTAVEPAAAMVEEGRVQHPRVRFVQAVGESLPWRDASVAQACLLYVLHHCDDPELVLSEARRVVRPGGRIVVVSGTEDCDRHRLFERYFPTLVPDLPDAHEISVYGRAAGLRLGDVRTTHHWVYPHRTIDEAYVEMVETQMFATLRGLNEIEFTGGVGRLRADLGRPLPPAEATLVVFERD